MIKNCRSISIVLLLFTVVLSGCTRTNIIDQLSIIHVYGFDLDDDGNVVGTALYPLHSKSRGNASIQFVEEKAPIGALVPPRMDQHTSMPIKLSKIRVLVFGKKFAETDTTEQVKRFILTPELGTNIQIVVSQQSAKETLKAIKNSGELTLADQLKHNMLHQNIPNMNLHVFLNHFFGEGMDAYLPMVTVEKNRVKVDGIGIFKDGKYCLRLNEKQSFLFSIIEDKDTEGLYKIKTTENGKSGFITVSGYRSKNKWELAGYHPNPKLKLTLKLKWVAKHYPNWIDINNPGDLKKLETIIESDIKKEVKTLLKTLQRNKVDPLGIGNIVRARDRDWEEKTFYKIYPEIPISINVKIQLLHTGLES
jgi:spore germination protein